MSLLSLLTIQPSSVLTVLLFMYFWSWLRRKFLRSSLWDLPGPVKASFLKGNLGQLFDQEGWDFHRDLVRRYGGAVKIYGLCGDERLYVSDPKSLYHIVLKDQDVYEETAFFIKTNLVCFGPGMVSVVGERHRRQRKLMGPVFNVQHLRGLTPVFQSISRELVNVLKRRFTSDEPGNQLQVDIFDWVKRTALEIIGQGGIGYSFGPLDDTSINEYRDSVKNFAPTLFRLSILRQFLPMLSELGPSWLRRAAICALPVRRVQRLREIVTVMDRTIRAVHADKLARLQSGDPAVRTQVGEGRDIMSVLLKSNMKSSGEDKLSDEEIIAQMSTLVFTGQDTVSAAIARVLHVLAEHPDAQARLRSEFVEAPTTKGRELDYDTLLALPFLDAVCRETLRLYPPVCMLHRTTTKDAVLPLSVPVRSVNGKPISTIALRRNTNVIIAIEAANRRPDIWGPDADVWRPERWLGRNRSYDREDEHIKGLPESETEAETKMPGVYSGLMTFLGGGRSCIGFNFAILEIKTILSDIIPVFYLDLPADEELAWMLGGIVSPGVKGDPVPKLPLRLTLVED